MPRGNQGWSTKPNSGRPPKTEEEKKRDRRPTHRIAAFDDEYEAIKIFVAYIRKHRNALPEIIETLKFESGIEDEE